MEWLKKQYHKIIGLIVLLMIAIFGGMQLIEHEDWTQDVVPGIVLVVVATISYKIITHKEVADAKKN